MQHRPTARRNKLDRLGSKTVFYLEKVLHIPTLPPPLPFASQTDRSRPSYCTGRPLPSIARHLLCCLCYCTQAADTFRNKHTGKHLMALSDRRRAGLRCSPELALCVSHQGCPTWNSTTQSRNVLRLVTMCFFHIWVVLSPRARVRRCSCRARRAHRLAANSGRASSGSFLFTHAPTVHHFLELSSSSVASTSMCRQLFQECAAEARPASSE